MKDIGNDMWREDDEEDVSNYWWTLDSKPPHWRNDIGKGMWQEDEEEDVRNYWWP